MNLEANGHFDLMLCYQLECAKLYYVREQKLKTFEENGCWKFLLKKTRKTVNLHVLRIKLPKKRMFSLSFVAGVILIRGVSHRKPCESRFNSQELCNT